MTCLNVHVKKYDTKIKTYSNGKVDIRMYSKPIICDVQIDKDTDKKNVGRVSSAMVSSAFKENENKRIRLDSLSRSRKLLIDYACENEKEFTSFITLTFRDNIEDLTIANKKFNMWTSKIRNSMLKQGKDFKYLGVPEFQKRGAVHYHLLTNLEIGSYWLKRQIGKDNMYDVKFWRHGFSSAFDLINGTDEKFNIALYITKYLYKDFDERLYGRTRVLKSNNLQKPSEFELMSENIVYKTAAEYIKNKKYQCDDFYYLGNSEENPYMIPFANYTYNLLQNDYNIIKIILEDQDMQF